LSICFLKFFRINYGADSSALELNKDGMIEKDKMMNDE
jgi:hypothetical protein